MSGKVKSEKGKGSKLEVKRDLIRPHGAMKLNTTF